MKVLLIALMFALQLHAASNENGSWDRRAAIAYLDARAIWWADWKPAARDHQTFCVSCHTSLPYALARPVLRIAGGEKSPAAGEKRLIDNVTKRVRLWSEVEPFYKGEQRSPESRGSEAIMNALILVSYGARAGKLDADARTALDQMLALQEKSGENAGSIIWMNFHFQPWEAEDARYWGATLAAVALGTAPADYRLRPGTRENVDQLRDYLTRLAPTQNLFNRANLLWASSKLPGLLTKPQQAAIVRDMAKEQREDGGWTASALLPSDWKRKDESAPETKTDGYATALFAFVLRDAGVPAAEAPLAKSLGWLRTHQDPTSGSWPAWSMNKQRDPASDAAKFMSDAATAYAVLALEAK